MEGSEDIHTEGVLKRPMHFTLVAFNARFTHSCLGLFHVRNELTTHCPEATQDFFQLTVNDPYFETLLRITATRPDAVFFSAAIWNSDLVERLIRDLRVCLPRCCFVVGGPQAEVVGANVQEGGCTVVAGPVEALGADFYQDLANDRMKAQYTGRLARMKEEAFVSPYRASDFDAHLRHRHVYYETSRGCPFSCTYCLSAAQQGMLHKEVSLVETELADILRHRPQTLRFVDRTFNDQPRRALAIWKFLAARATETLCHFEISPDCFSEEMFAFLEGVPPGRFQFEIGIQSTNPETLRAVRRPMPRAAIHALVGRLASFGNIHLHVDLILGLPYETEASFLHSFAEVFAMGAHYIQMGLLKILPDTPICQHAGDYGYQHCRRPPYAIIASRWMDHETLAGLYWLCECVERFLNNRYFVPVWDYLRRSGEDIVAFFTNLLAVCRAGDFFSVAATQELMSMLLLRATAGRDDTALFPELLRFCWLRCGHRFLPECLAPPDGAGQAVAIKKKRLFQLLPEHLEGLYLRGEKSQFLKKGFLAMFSERCLRELGYAGHRGCGVLCFLPERETGLYAFNRVVRLLEDAGCRDV